MGESRYMCRITWLEEDSRYGAESSGWFTSTGITYLRTAHALDLAVLTSDRRGN